MFKRSLHTTHGKGFTLIEVMIVVVILSLLAAIVVPNLIGRQEKAMAAKARIDITGLENSLKLYKSDNFHYPSTEQGLDALVKKPSGSPEPKNWNKDGYMDRLPKDPWGNPYQYLNPGTHGKIDVYSMGPDGVNSEDDIGNWNKE